MKKPIIGIVLDSELEGTFAPEPYYALRENYIDCFDKYGVVMIAIPHYLDSIPDYLGMLDGLVLSGGASDVNPDYYHESLNRHTFLNVRRNKFDMAIAKQAYDLNVPTLGICAGFQCMHVTLGGSLHQHIPEYLPGDTKHYHRNKHKTKHAITVFPDTLLHKAVQTDVIHVNSLHHQCVRDTGKNVTICGISPTDNIVESIEASEKDFYLGVQWHPEYEPTSHDTMLLEFFINQVKEIKAKRQG